MTISRLQCWWCGITFYGRGDARYCCGACRQKAYRGRTARRVAVEAVPAPKLGKTRADARQTRQKARAARERAAAARRTAADTLATLDRVGPAKKSRVQVD
jgi:hypothetical protein